MHAVLKGTSLFCYHRQQDVEANVEPAFTIAINKVSKGITGKSRNRVKHSTEVDSALQNQLLFFFGNASGIGSVDGKELRLSIAASLNLKPASRL